ncbi:MAG TPA: PA14 domain-containing protein [Thermoanaerobaculia bacterium]|nr:PA14 domain-containing protein [Thermoanaerobaculia bacterium]
MTSSSARRSRQAAAGALALVLAASGEAIIRSGRSFWLGLALYAAAALVFAPGAFPPLPTKDEPSAGSPRLRPWLFAACLALSLAVAGASLRSLWLDNERRVAAGWIASAALGLVAAILAGRSFDVPARWGAAPLPSTRAGRAWAAAGLAVILVAAAATRLFGLAKVPFGINPDEGDRAAPAIRILLGTDLRSVFDFGWYHISMVYFKVLAGVMSFAGMNVAGARAFGALCGVLTVAVVTFLAIRHFGWRTGIFSGLLLAAMGVAIQFSRITTEATPTALLWAISAAAFLEAARSGRAWTWALAGLSGGFSLYFYPTGRMWCLIAAAFGIALLVKGPAGSRARTAAGLAVAAIGSLLAAAPFLVVWVKTPGEFSVRAQETYVFNRENARRLTYYQPNWSTARLAAAQVEHGLGVFNRYSDQNLTWPTERTLFPPVLAAITLLGVLSALAKFRDPRLLLLALWFWVGFAGIVVTVETPNLHRMGAAVPVLGVLAALVLDEIARRIEALGSAENPGTVRRLAPLAAVTIATVALAAVEIGLYFGPYAHTDRWPWTRVEGETVAREGDKGLAVTLGSSAHMINSGWVRLLAPDARRLAIPDPGLNFPLAIKPERDLAFLVYDGQRYYVPYLQQLYPGGTVRRVLTPEDQPVVTVYRVPLPAVEKSRGALVFATGSGADSVRVASLGDPPPGWTSFPHTFRWSAALRAPYFGNYSFRASGRVTVDGREILRPDPAKPVPETTVSLPDGEHRIVFEASVESAGKPAVFEWKGDSPGGPWRRTEIAELGPVDGPTRGLSAVFQGSQGPVRKRLDGAIAAMALSEDVRFPGEWNATWRGTLFAPADGKYAFAFRTNGGVVELKIDGRPVVRTHGEDDRVERGGDFLLSAGPHPVEIAYRVVHGPGGIDFLWTPPGQPESVVPPSALQPAESGPGDPLPEATLTVLRSLRHEPGAMTAP